MLFVDNRTHFFRPLTGKYRAQIVECLRELYARLYSSMADYSRLYNREQIIEIFQEAIARAPVLDEGGRMSSPPPPAMNVSRRVGY